MRAPKSFEEGMDRLNTILAQMQQEDTSLADSVKLYAEAASLMQYHGRNRARRVLSSFDPFCRMYAWLFLLSLSTPVFSCLSKKAKHRPGFGFGALCILVRL